MLRGLALLALAAITDGFVSRCPSSRIRASTSSSRAAFLGLDLPELHAELPAFEVPALALPVASLESIGPVPVLAAENPRALENPTALLALLGPLHSGRPQL